MLENFLLGAWNLIRGKMIWILVLCAIAAVPLGYGASQLKTEAGPEHNFRVGSDERKGLEVLADTFGQMQLAVVVKGSDIPEILSDQNLAAMKNIEDALADNPNILMVISPEFMLRTLKSFGSVPKDATPAEAILDPETGEIVPKFQSSFFNRQHAVIGIGFVGRMDSQESADLTKVVMDIVDNAGFDGNVQVIQSGYPVMMEFITTELPKTLSKLMTIAILLMLVLLTFGFRVRGKIFRRWIVLGLVLLSVVYTMGIMGFVNIPLTAASMLVFPILLGMSVDSCLQTHNRYDEESRKGKTADECVKTTVRRVIRPLWMGMSLCLIGFASVLIVDSQQITYYGMALIIGTAIAMVVMLFLIVGILYLLDKRSDDTRKPAPRPAGALEKSMGWLTPRLAKYSPFILIVAIVAGGFGWYYERDMESYSGFEGAADENSQVWKDLMYLKSFSGGIAPLDVIVEVPEDRNVLEPEMLQWVLDKSNELVEKHGIAAGGYAASVTSVAHVFQDQMNGLPKSAEQAQVMLEGVLPRPIWIVLVNEDYTALHISLKNGSDGNDEVEQTLDALGEIFVDPPLGGEVIITGVSSAAPTMADNLTKSRTAIMVFGVGFILLAMLFMFKFNYRRVLAAAFPVLLVLGWSGLVLKITGFHVSMFMSLMPAQLMAIGIEFTILLLMRYYEERDKGENPILAMTTAMTRIGRAIVISGGMIFIGFGVLIFANALPQIQDFGWAAMFDMVLVIVATLVVLPALVLAFDFKFRGGKITDPVLPIEDIVSAVD